MRLKTANRGFAISLLVMLAAQVLFLTKKIQPADPSLYALHGIELATTSNWRYGYLAGMHGAFLVKVPITAAEPKASARPPELRSVMSTELRSIPLKFGLETVFYACLLAYGFFLAPRLRDALRSRAGQRKRRLVGSLVPGALFFVLAAAPLLIRGYGYGGFSNLVGPDAMSYSGPYFHWQTWLHNSSNSISYRAFVSPIMLPAGVLVQLTWAGLRSIPVYGPLMDSEPETTLLYWLAGALAYGALGLTIEGVRAAIVRLRNKEATPFI